MCIKDYDMDELYYDAVDLLKALISVPSISREEDKAADIVAGFLENNGCEVRRSGNNVWTVAAGYSSEKPTLLLRARRSSALQPLICGCPQNGNLTILCFSLRARRRSAVKAG